MFEWYGTPAFDRWGKYLLDLGLIEEEEVGDLEVLDKWWQEGLDLSARFYQNGGPRGKRVTPREALRALAETGGAGAGSRGRSAGFTGRRTQTSRDVDLTNPETAKAIVNDVLADALGRAATDDELEAFRSALNAHERANPRVTTTTTDFEDGQAVSSSSTSQGGVDGAGRQQIALDKAMSMPEYGAYQAAATYFPVLAQAIQSPV